MRMLVAVASYGTGNDGYLRRLIEEYQGMDHRVDIVVLSNIRKELGPDVEVRVGLPDRNPWSLPFAHKGLFSERAKAYDLFIYSEDDTLIRQRNIDSFLTVSKVLPKNQIAGFIRSEIGPDGASSFSTIHSHFRWLPESIQRSGEYVFARYSNDHSGCYILTREQLDAAIRSGGFSVRPHSERYDLLVSAATDPYTQCGFEKVVCISHLDDFVVPHLPNKYVGKIGLDGRELRKQVAALLAIANGNRAAVSALPEARVQDRRWCKNYYEPCRQDILSLIPENVMSVLSLGCASGDTEAHLVRKGVRVSTIPADSVISVLAEDKGIEVIEGDFETGRTRLRGRRFDCVLALNVLQLVEDPVTMLHDFQEFLAPNGCFILQLPNLAWPRLLRWRLSGDQVVRRLGAFPSSGVHRTTAKVVRDWLNRADLDAKCWVRRMPRRLTGTLGILEAIAGPYFASEFLVIARPNNAAEQRSLREESDLVEA